MKTFKLFFNSNQNSKSIDFMETAGVSSSYAPRWVEYVDEIGINDLNLEQIQFKAKDGTLYTISDF